MRTLLLLALVACSSGSKAPAPPSSGSPPPPSAEHTACATDADCVIVETACCDHCNGGAAEAFNVAFAAQHKPTGCENTACTELGCGAAVAACEAGTCKASIAPLPGM